MAIYTYLDLLARVEAVVYSNETREIKAELLQQLLKDMVDSHVSLEYDTDRNYEPGGFCVYDGGSGYKAYVCIAPTSGAFAGGDWSQIGV